MIAPLKDKKKVFYLIDNETSGADFLVINDVQKQVCTSVKDAIWRPRTGY